MKIAENDIFLIVDTEYSNILNPVFIFHKNTGMVLSTTNDKLEDFLSYFFHSADNELIKICLYKGII